MTFKADQTKRITAYHLAAETTPALVELIIYMCTMVCSGILWKQLNPRAPS